MESGLMTIWTGTHGEGQSNQGKDRDMLGLLERLVHFRIHFDCHVVIRHDPLISLSDFLVNPNLEWLTNDCVNQVGQVWSWQLLSFSFHRWKRLHHLWYHCRVHKHGFQLQAIEVRDCDVLDVDLLYPSSSASCQISHVKDGDRLILRQEESTVMSEKTVDLPLTLVLSSKGRRVNRDLLLLVRYLASRLAISLIWILIRIFHLVL